MGHGSREERTVACYGLQVATRQRCVLFVKCRVSREKRLVRACHAKAWLRATGCVQGISHEDYAW